MTIHDASDIETVDITGVTPLYAVLGRLKMFFAIVEQSIRTEYIYDDRAVDDWLYSLDWLEDSLFLIYDLMRKSSATAHQDILKEERVLFFKSLLSDTRNTLIDGGLDAVGKLYSLLDAMVRLHGGLALWQKELSKDFPGLGILSLDVISRSTSRSLAPSAMRLLGRLMEEFGTHLQNKDEFNTCMISRKIYLILYYTVAVHPEEWYSRLHQQILRQHESALLELAPGRATERISLRAEKLKEFDEKGFMKAAMAVAG